MTSGGTDDVGDRAFNPKNATLELQTTPAAPALLDLHVG